jgi:hypothetical protein
MVAKAKRPQRQGLENGGLARGLAPPIGKKASRQALNGHANGKPQQQPPPPPPLHVDALLVDEHAATQSQSAPDAFREALANTPMAGPPMSVARAPSDVSLDGYDNLDPAPPTALARVNTGGSKTPPVNMLTITATILSSCPLRDVLAILST